MPAQVCRGAAAHLLHPFGTHANVRNITLNSRKACLVWPSEDQGAPWDAEVVLQYPKPILIDGQLYGQLIVNADKAHVVAIARSIEFLQ